MVAMQSPFLSEQINTLNDLPIKLCEFFDSTRSRCVVPYRCQLKLNNPIFPVFPSTECATNAERNDIPASQYRLSDFCHLSSSLVLFWCCRVTAQLHHSTPANKSARPEDDIEASWPQSAEASAAERTWAIAKRRQDARSWFGWVLDGVPITDFGRAHQSLRR